MISSIYFAPFTTTKQLTKSMVSRKKYNKKYTLYGLLRPVQMASTSFRFCWTMLNDVDNWSGQTVLTRFETHSTSIQLHYTMFHFD